MTPDQLAALHARCFPGHPRPWSAAEFADLLADEAELLTLAVAPEARRMGLARALLAEFAQVSSARGAHEAFLEVASDNAPAIALYTGNGWQGAGIRRDYYAPGIDAVVMRLPLRHPGAATEAC